jgi:hypothetical protein
MKKAINLILGVSAELIFLTSCNAQQTKNPALLTKQIVKETIHKNYYPPIDEKWHKTKLEFHSIQIGKPDIAGKLKIWHFPDTTILYPVLAKYTVTDINLHDSPYPYKYTVDDITSEYVFYIDQWGNWGVKQNIHSTENSDITSHHD